MVFMKNHEGATIAHAVHEAKRFIADHPVDGVKIRLASGNVGVMAATNEAVESAEAKMLLAIFGALALLCLLTFRSWRATICVLVPLMMVSRSEGRRVGKGCVITGRFRVGPVPTKNKTSRP